MPRHTVFFGKKKLRFQKINDKTNELIVKDPKELKIIKQKEPILIFRIISEKCKL